MFKRKWSSLPKDPSFPSDMKELGYFVNEDDEIRSIEDSQYYFKYFLSRNDRWNVRQRFHFNQAVQEVIHERLEKLDMDKVLLPLGTEDLSHPHVPIFVSRGIETKGRVVVIVGETCQDLGLLAHRIVGGHSGINKGSMVSIVSELQKQPSSSTDASPPGIILANIGELFWWPEGKRTLSRSAFHGAPMYSAVHFDNRVVEKINTVPGNRNRQEHVRYIFEQVVPRFVTNPEAGLDIIGIGDGADYVEDYLDHEAVWNRLGERINCLAIMGGFRPSWDIRCECFRTFLRDRARAYIASEAPLDTVLSGPEGNVETSSFTRLGCPVFSAGEAAFTELLLIASRDVVLGWLLDVNSKNNSHGTRNGYKNPDFIVTYTDPGQLPAEPDWTFWEAEKVALDAKREQEEKDKDNKDGIEGEKKKEKKKEDNFVVKVDSLSDSDDAN